jgi:glycosyltransferase involved in cell wall biosynthesis
MFAYNEEANIVRSIESVFHNVDENLNAFCLIANGCTDNTVSVASATKDRLGFDSMHIKQITLGDKCNAWNTYVHEYSHEHSHEHPHKRSDYIETHFFTDADVRFSDQCFVKMSHHLASSESDTVVIAGMPLSGRNNAFYYELVTQRACFFGNLYGMRQSFIQRIKETEFRLPIGLNWIDSFLTKAVNTDLTFGKDNLPNRTTWIESVGYQFDSLTFWKQDDIKLYFNRIARYELGKIQEHYLDALNVASWPESMTAINHQIWADFDAKAHHLSWFKKRLVRQRLKKIIDRSQGL